MFPNFADPENTILLTHFGRTGAICNQFGNYRGGPAFKLGRESNWRMCHVNSQAQHLVFRFILGLAEFPEKDYVSVLGFWFSWSIT